MGGGRIDLLIRWPLPSGEVERFAVELKVWRRGPDPLEKGLTQLGGYLDRLGLDHGTLILFDQRPDAAAERAEQSAEERDGRQITVLRL